MYVFQHGIIASVGGGGDADASAFITTASITDPTQQSAINQLVLDLKSYSIWSKLEAIYPYVGGNATSHSYNLKDTNQFQITWSGGVTHDSNGVTGNGTNGTGNTNLVPGFVLTNFISMGAYIGTNVSENSRDMGVLTIGLKGSLFNSRDTSNRLSSLVMDGTTKNILSITDSRGLTCINRTTTTDRQVYKNGIVTNTTNTSAGYSNFNVHVLSSASNNVADFFSSRNQRFSFIGNSLTDVEQANLYTAVQSFQTTLSRNV